MPLHLDEARARAGLLSDISYDLEIDLTDRAAFTVAATVRFTCSGAETFLELTGARDLVVSGADWSYDGERIRLSGLGGRHEIRVGARLDYVHDGDGMHTFTDPADDETYVCAYAGMDLARRIFPCFDQPDLKATVSLAVRAPEGWTVVGNGRTEQDGPLWRFATTPPIPTYLVTLAAGPWASVRWEHRGLPFAWHARRSAAPALARDADELRTITEACFAHLVDAFDEPFGFDSYDQVFAPGLNWGAMEFPGAVVFRDEMLPDDPPSLPRRRYRAMVIAHEMAHMWFGDLATLEWWQDAWLNESFADYIGYHVSDVAAGFSGMLVDLTIDDLPSSFAADERRSTHPVAAEAEEVPDADTALGNFDSLTYAKGGAALRQLVTWLGEEEFLAGANAYLSRYRWANASLADFVDCLDAASSRDVRAWTEVWLRTTGFDTLEVRRTPDGPVLVREGIRPHRMTVAAYDADGRLVRSELVDVADEPVPVPDGALVVPNAGGETFARLRLDDASWTALVDGLGAVADDLTRAVLWTHVFDRVRRGDLAVREGFALLGRHLPAEPRPSIVAAAVEWALHWPLTWWVPADELAEAEAVLARALADGLARAGDAEVARTLAEGLARVTRDPDLLRGWLDGRVAYGPGGGSGLEVDGTLRWLAWWQLARLGKAGEEEILAAADADGGYEARLGAERALAAVPTPEAKQAAWARLFEDPDISNRTFSRLAQGLWDPRQPDLLAGYVDRYPAEAVAFGARSQAAAQLAGIAFPGLRLEPAQVAAIEAVLAGDGVPTLVRRAWEDHLDDVRAPWRAVS